MIRNGKIFEVNGIGLNVFIEGQGPDVILDYFTHPLKY